MVYVCENCGALFSRASKQDHCPDCGKNLIRSANHVEQHEYASRMAELIRKNCLEAPRFPNIVVTEISILNAFAFKIPVTALQIDSGMVIEVSVEFGENAADPNDLTANLWARQENGTGIGYLTSVHLPMKQDEPVSDQINRIFSSLSENETFKAKLYGFVIDQLTCTD